jgi:hypothetical protein
MSTEPRDALTPQQALAEALWAQGSHDCDAKMLNCAAAILAALSASGYIITETGRLERVEAALRWALGVLDEWDLPLEQRSALIIDQAAPYKYQAEKAEAHAALSPKEPSRE